MAVDIALDETLMFSGTVGRIGVGESPKTNGREYMIMTHAREQYGVRCWDKLANISQREVGKDVTNIDGMVD